MAYRRRDDMLSTVLNKHQVGELINLRQSGWTHKEIANYFSIHRKTVGNILRRAKQSKEYDYDGE